MKRQDAIQTLKAHLEHWERLLKENIAQISEGEKAVCALKMAIEALQTEVVRCKDCRHSRVEGDTTMFMWCGYWNKPTDGSRYCSDGKRKGGEDE